MNFHPPTLLGENRCIFIGQTGSGKSFMARFLLKVARLKKWRIVIVDPKKDWMRDGEKVRPFADNKHLGTVDNPRLVSNFDPGLAVQIFQPVEWNTQCESFFKKLLQTRYTIVYIDEITQLADANRIPLEIRILWTQGRSLHIGAWCGTQRPKRIPADVKDQAEIWYVFRILSKKDREVLDGYLPMDDMPEIIEKPLPKHWYWFWMDSMIRPVLIRPLKLKKVA